MTRTYIIWIILAAGGLSSHASGQTQIDLARQATNIDFTLISPTKPFSMGGSLPGTCVQGSMFFLTGVANGQNVYGCPATNTWALEGGNSGGGTWGSITGTLSSQTDLAAALATKPTCGLVTTVGNPGLDTNCASEAAVRAALGGALGQLTVQIGGSAVGTQSALNFISGNGIIQACSNNSGASRVDCTPAIDTAVVLSRATDQLGTGHSIVATSSSVGATFIANGTPTLSSYSQNGWFWFVAKDHDCAANATLNIDGLGPIPLQKLSSGTLVNVSTADCKMGIPYMIVAVGSPVTSFRLLAPGL